MEHELREHLAQIREVAGIDLDKMIRGITTFPGNGILVIWDSFENMKYSDIVDHCFQEFTVKKINHTFSPGKRKVSGVSSVI